MRVACLLSFFAFAFAEAASAAPAEPATDAKEYHDLAYVEGGHERQKLDLYLPRTPGPHPLIVWVHGGAWSIGDKTICPAKPYVTRGYAVASIGYRLSQHAIYPAQIQDCKAAVRWLRAHAKEYEIDPAHIGAWGSSAGGHLVSLLGATGDQRGFDVGANLDQSSAVQCVVDWYGPVDFLHWGNSERLTPRVEPRTAQLLGGMPATRQEEARRASPVYFVNAKTAPFLILHGDQDPRVPLQQSQELDDALRKAGVQSKLIVVAGGEHGGEPFMAPECRAAMDAFFAKWLRGH